MRIPRNSHLARLVALSLLITFSLPFTANARTRESLRRAGENQDKKDKKDEAKKDEQKKDEKPKLSKEEKEYQKIKKFSLDLYLKDADFREA